MPSTLVEPRTTELKVVLVGSMGVGKTATVLRFIKNQYKDILETTIGASYMCKTLDIDDKPIKFSVWDTAGQEQYHSLVPLYFRKAAAVIVVYDITRSQTFDEAKRWIKEITGAPEDVILVLTGSKSDLSNLRQVETRTGSNYAKEIGALFIETSSKSATNVEQLFELIGKKYVARMNGVVDDEPDLDTGVTISSHMETAPRTGCC